MSQSSAIANHAVLERIELEMKGRIGAASINMQNGYEVGYRSHERFPMCSTFKFLVVAEVLKRADTDKKRRSRPIRFGENDLVPNSPFCQARVQKGGASVVELCRAAMVESDNTAANLLVSLLGGPSAVTGHARSLNDGVTRLDRWEPELNEALPGDDRDTTTPSAMVSLLCRVLLGNRLADGSKQLLMRWMSESLSGHLRIRSGVPFGWSVAHKSGTGHNGATADIGIVSPPGGSPVLLAIYLKDCAAPLHDREASIAAVTKVLVQDLVMNPVPAWHFETA